MQTILFVEDELELARVVARELSAAGYRVEHVVDGDAAWVLFGPVGGLPAALLGGWDDPARRDVGLTAAYLCYGRMRHVEWRHSDERSHVYGDPSSDL